VSWVGELSAWLILSEARSQTFDIIIHFVHDRERRGGPPDGGVDSVEGTQPSPYPQRQALSRALRTGDMGIDRRT
jgi:hypothetical protein